MKMIKMRAVIFHEHGGLDKLQYVEDFPIPEIGPDDVLLNVKAAALNHLDIFTREGMPGLTLKLPHVPGSDMSGIIADIGKNVTFLEKGDRVAINPGIWDNTCEFCLQGEHSLCTNFHILGEHLPGGYAEYSRVPARNCVKLPDHISFQKAAAGSLAYLTAWRMLMTQAKARPTDDILIIGAGGGVSSAAIQIAKLVGARVIATTSTEKKMEEAKKIGADIVINYKTDPDWSKTVYTLTKKRGVDIVIDNIGAATWENSLRTLRKGGCLVTCGATTGGIVKTNINMIFWRQLQIFGSTMATQHEFLQVMKLIFEGKLDPTISKEFPLAQARNAQEYLFKMEQFGKVVLNI